ncbi:alkaline phosphatase-like protein [Aspergillus steynii IBT 23096]|uniref:GPI ethanolamine phosphate transferase 2 n=1 Tax=Aspergillus steynii IBT 23096 TaxID=1392250 RepID=A0A2I2G9H8_9EURO|nr:alkaline phosphatase-like protein [Aspergillus steynii IBT 23096]PLB49539.1 alkaline phosphatase-like protein [Aspergillus steynii IBT 23096]
MNAIPQSSAVLLANVLIPIAVIFFSAGFFPYKPLLPGLASHEGRRKDEIPPRVFDKVIFMVIDALRSDFVYSNSSGFSFTQGLIRAGAALPFTAYASSPTVTMPRLKAITTGSVPSFLDVILNIAETDTSSTLAHQDTWLTQLKANGDKLVMYGDDTWLKLFPGMFSRADGTTSFFVSDFTEVDNNVTRHIPDELLRNDWSALILHYLGLDHIGHKSGPRSPFMIPKQQEMDSVVTQVYTALEREEHLKSALFVVCGDHGMTDAGNHGGSSVTETSPALLFISPAFKKMGIRNESPAEPASDLQYYRTVEQTDITPTLAGLLGLPVPMNNLGTFIPELLQMWHGRSQRIHMLMENSKQMLQVVKAAFPGHTFKPESMPPLCSLEPSKGIEEVQCAWSRVLAPDGAFGDDAETSLLSFLRGAQTLMSSAASDYDIKSLHIGMCVTGVAVWLSFAPLQGLLCKYKRPGTFLLFAISSYGGMMFASSYVEEEQQFWYWLCVGWIFFLYTKPFSAALGGYKSQHKSTGVLFAKLGVIGLAASHRILRRWNQTGQKFAAEPDVARAFLPSHPHILWALVILTYVDVCLHLVSGFSRSVTWAVMVFVVVVAAFLFKLASVASDSFELLSGSVLEPMARLVGGIPLVLHARFVDCGIFLLVAGAMYLRKTSGPSQPRKGSGPSTIVHEALTLLLVTQSRIANVPIFLIFRIQLIILGSVELPPIELAIMSILMQYTTYFAFGGSNAISSVDLSNAYNGIGSYNVVFVGILTFIGNWAGPIWWTSASWLLRRKQSRKEKQSHVTILTFHTATMLLSVMAACTFLRTHLFIWTVFSPKYLYTTVWAILYHMAVNLLGELTFPVVT